MAQSISALTTLPLSSDRSSFISKPQLTSLPKSFKHKPNSNSIVSMAAADARGGDLDHLQRVSGVRPQQPQPKRRPDAAAASSVGLWDRFPTARTLQQMMETMERVMEDPLAYTTTYPPPSPPAHNGSYSRGRTPWEIKEGESEYRMRFDMPGMTKEDVKVWVEEKMLVVQAEKMLKRKQKEGGSNGTTTTAAGMNGNGSNEAAVEVEEEEKEWPAKSFGRYKTRIALPENVQFEKIKAEVKDGVLYITVPKARVSAKVLDIAVQ